MKRLGALLLLSSLAGCSVTSGEYAAIDSCLAAGQAWNYRTTNCERSADGPVDLIVVDKSAHRLSVYRAGRLIREFRVALGRGGPGPKVQQGDGRVPEGTYRIVAHNPNSAFHLSLRIGYPTPEQIAAATRRGVNAGGDIMIHGLPNQKAWIGAKHTTVDWTDGCVAVTNAEMDWLYKAVPDGTRVDITA
jgi:murein L,D-transpeptidase YafK